MWLTSIHPPQTVPNRKCKEAKYFVPNDKGMLTPYEGEDPNVPPCPRCPMVLSGDAKAQVQTCQVRRDEGLDWIASCHVTGLMPRSRLS